MNIRYYIEGPHTVSNLFNVTESELFYNYRSPLGFSYESVPNLYLFTCEFYLWALINLYIKPALAFLVLTVYKK